MRKIGKTTLHSSRRDRLVYRLVGLIQNSGSAAEEFTLREEAILEMPWQHVMFDLRVLRKNTAAVLNMHERPLLDGPVFSPSG